MRSKRVWLSTFVSVFFLIWLFRGTDYQQLATAFTRANYIWLIPAIGIYFVGVWFRAWRWRFLLAPIKVLSASRLFPIVVIGYMANDILPVRMGEFVKTYLLGEKEGISKSSIFATVAIERMFDGLTLLFFMAIVSFFVPFSGWLQGVAQLSAVFFVGLLIVFFAVALSKSFAMGIAGSLLRFLPSSVSGKAQELLGLFIEGLTVLRSPRTLAAVFLTSALAWLAEATMYYLVMYSFDFRQPFSVIVLTTATANIGISIPSSQGGIGPFEVFVKETLGLFGVGEDMAIAYSIVLHASLLLPPILLGFFYLWRENLSLGRITRQRTIESRGDVRLP